MVIMHFPKINILRLAKMLQSPPQTLSQWSMDYVILLCEVLQTLYIPHPQISSIITMWEHTIIFVSLNASQTQKMLKMHKIYEKKTVLLVNVRL